MLTGRKWASPETFLLYSVSVLSDIQNNHHNLVSWGKFKDISVNAFRICDADIFLWHFIAIETGRATASHCYQLTLKQSFASWLHVHLVLFAHKKPVSAESSLFAISSTEHKHIHREINPDKHIQRTGTRCWCKHRQPSLNCVYCANLTFWSLLSSVFAYLAREIFHSDSFYLISHRNKTL